MSGQDIEQRHHEMDDDKRHIAVFQAGDAAEEKRNAGNDELRLDTLFSDQPFTRTNA
jgi:hypothetical protein